MNNFNLIKHYNEKGYVIVDFMNLNEFNVVKELVLDHINNLIGLSNRIDNNKISNFNWKKYHIFIDKNNINHDEHMKSSNRHISSSIFKKTKLMNKSLLKLIAKLSEWKNINYWDEGIGVFGIRIIRPNYNDGYPWGCKSWGPAGEVISVWMPIISLSSPYTIALWPESHKKKFDSYQPKKTKFEKNELRLKKLPRKNEIIRPNMQIGQILIFHQNLQHSENVTEGNDTRISLELRLKNIN